MAFNKSIKYLAQLLFVGVALASTWQDGAQVKSTFRQGLYTIFNFNVNLICEINTQSISS